MRFICYIQLASHVQLWSRDTIMHFCWCGAEKVTAVAQTCLSQQGSSLKSQHIMQGPNFIPIMQGPNFMWHLDGYDKLSHFHFCVHGCIDR